MDVQPELLSCAACGTLNDAGRKFCKECGAAMAVACATCGAQNSGDSKFCGECGSALSPAAIAEASTGAAPSSSERRLVSVLFADLVGFTTLSEHRDAEDVRELLSRYFEISRAVIERHGGLVEKFIGDAVMAVWGTPIAYEDDAERAVRAGLELVVAVEDLGRDVELDLRARAGVLTGQAATTTGGVSEGIVVGDMVNTASRLQSVAEPGTVLVGEATYRSASKAVAFDEIGELTLKGKDEHVRAWHALRVIGQRGGAGRVAGFEPPYVGRAEELRLIKEQLHAAGRDGKARLISTIGVGGIGKSRLAWEFRKYVDGLADDIYWHQGRCPAYGDGVTFWALGEMVRMRAGIAETDDAEVSRTKLAAAVREYMPDDEERRWAEPRLAHLLGLEDRPPGERDELFSAWRTLFERIADLGPTVMVFEDLQWADAGLLDFIESTLEWSKDRPLLIVALARPELLERRPDWGMNQRSFTSLRLDPMPDDLMTKLVQGFVPDLGGSDVERIVAQADGIPLYAVETVRMLADRGVLEPRANGYAVVGDVGTLQVPETLHALIAARLDALPPQDRALLQDASVLGKSFTGGGLAVVTGSSPGVLEERLNALARKEFLVHEVDPRSPERGQYTFMQSLIREVAYSTLTKADRRRRHLAAADHLASIGDDELVGVVASHYLEALRASPDGPDQEALAAQARDWLGRAADRARSLGSSEQALLYAEQALEIAATGPERATALTRAAQAAYLSGYGHRALELFEEAIELRKEEGDTVEVARLTALWCDVRVFAERGEDPVERCEAALAELGAQDDAVACQLHEVLSAARFLRGEILEALHHAELGLAIAERLGLNKPFSDLLARKANVLYSLGRHREAVILARGIVEGVDPLDHSERSMALTNLGVLSAEEDPRQSLDVFLDSAEAARRAGNRFDEVMGLTNAAESAIDAGEFEQADRVLAELDGREIPEANKPSLALDRALLAAYRGAHDVAATELDAVADVITGLQILPLETWYLRTRASASLMAGDTDAAFAFVLAALEPDPTGMNATTSIGAGVHAALWSRDAERTRTMVEASAQMRRTWIMAVRAGAEAGLAALEGRTDEAKEGFIRALRAWDDLALPLDHALCVIDAVSVMPPDSLPPNAIRRAVETLERLEVVPALERLNAAVRVRTEDVVEDRPALKGQS